MEYPIVFLDIREKTKELHDEGFTGSYPVLVHYREWCDER